MNTPPNIAALGRWQRTWDSPRPDVLTITDSYELAAGDGVEFYWQTLLPVTVEGRRAVITGARGRVELAAPRRAGHHRRRAGVGGYA